MEELINFGNYGVLDGVVRNFAKEPEWEWRFKPVTSGMELEMSKFNMHNRVAQGIDGVRHERPPTYMEIAYREIALTFNGTNIPKGPEDSEPILPLDASVEQVESMLRRMPNDMVMEIWIMVGELYPNWGPADPNSLIRTSSPK
jgi:hypothetical protein